MEAWLETITDLTCLCGSAQPAREMACTCRVVDNGGEHQRQQTVLQQQLSICPKPNQLWNYSRTPYRSIKAMWKPTFWFRYWGSSSGSEGCFRFRWKSLRSIFIVQQQTQRTRSCAQEQWGPIGTLISFYIYAQDTMPKRLGEVDDN